MANTTDYTRLLDGYSLLAIRDYAAPKESPTFTGTVTLPTSVKIGSSTATGLVKYTNGQLSIDTTSYLAANAETWREIKVGSTQAIGPTSNTALVFQNSSHSVQFGYIVNSGLYADVNLKNYSPVSGHPFLDSNFKIDETYLPDSVLGQLQYKGVWNATSPSWPSGQTKSPGDYYICQTSGGKWPDGTTATGKTFVVGDWAIWTGSGTEADPYRWEKVDNTDAISSITLVSGDALTGAVTIPAASDTAYGLVKVYGVEQAEIAMVGRYYGIYRQPSGKLFVNVPWTDTNYYAKSSFTSSNGIKIATGYSGSSTSTTYDLYVPKAAANQLGVVGIGYSTSGKNYKLQVDSDGNGYVNVPWTDTNYYPTRLYSSGLQISTSTNVTDTCALYVPEANGDQAGVITKNAQTFNGTKTFTGDIIQSEGYIVVTSGDDIASFAADVNKLYINLSNDAGASYTNYILNNLHDGSTHTIALEEKVILKTLTSAKGDMIYASAANTPARLAIGSNGQFLRVNSSGVPVWQSVTLPATNVIPATTTANKVLLSTTTSGTAAWSAWSSAGFLKTNASGVVSIDTNSYSLSNHTHTISLVSGGTATVNLAYNTAYTLTAGGNSVIFKMPASDNTDTKNTTGATQVAYWQTPIDLYLVGAAAQAANPITYSSKNFYLKCLSDGYEVLFVPSIDTLPTSKSGSTTQLHGIGFHSIVGQGTVTNFLLMANTSEKIENPGNGDKYVNINTYSTQEATYILQGKNSDGTNI